jgi:hypothetical protein
MKMEYLEIHKEHFEEVCQELGREPTWKELENSYRHKIECMFDFYRDFVRLDGNLQVLKRLIYSIK